MEVITILDKKYYLWMQIIADLDSNFNFDIYFKLKKVLKKDIVKLYDEKYIDKYYDILLDLGLNTSTINLLRSRYLKENTEKLYDSLLNHGYKLYTIYDYNYVFKYRPFKFQVPFCIVVKKEIDLNSKNIIVYYNDYFSRGAVRTIKFISKIIVHYLGNAISSSNVENTISIDVIEYKNLIDVLSNLKKDIIISNIKYMDFFLIMFVDSLVLIEARKERRVEALVNLFSDTGKDVYVIPSFIFNKNSYFSNYLIKQGADVILNAGDIKKMLNDT